MNITKLTIQDLKMWFENSRREEIYSFLPELRNDKRSGVQKLIQSWEQRETLLEQEKERWNTMIQEEKRLRADGYRYIVGIDEVGRGPLAGPVVAAAVILPEDFYLLGINDSKKLSASKREELGKEIKEKAVSFAVSFIEAKEIDRINIYEATKVAMIDALRQLSPQPDYALIDAMKLSINLPYQAIIKGDSQSISIAAASIIAKVARDEYMVKIAELYPNYGFDRHMGYGTKEHLEAIKKYGVTPIHRRTFLTNILS